MGAEHQAMDALWAYGVSDGVEAKKFGGAATRSYPPGFVTPNQRKALRTLWGFQAITPAERQAAEKTLIEDYSQQLLGAGHCCDGAGRRIEIGTASHGQIWLAAAAGDLCLARRWRSEALQSAVEKWWRNETAMCRRCVIPMLLPDQQHGEARHVLIPGCRDGSADHPQVTNSNRDRVIGAVVNEWRRPPATPRHGSYDASIALLKLAFAAGADPARLLGDEPTLPPRFGWHVKTTSDGFYAWFSAGLEGALEPLWGAGWIGGQQQVLRWDVESARAYGEGLAAA